MGTDARGASNAKATRELGWTPRHPSWRKGFPVVYSALSVSSGSSAGQQEEQRDAAPAA